MVRSEQEIVHKWAYLMEEADRLYEYDDEECVSLSREYSKQAKLLRWVLGENNGD